MENITLGQIAVALAFVAGLIVACGTIFAFVKKALNKMFEEQMNGFNDRIDTLKKRVDRNNMESCKNYLVYFLVDVDKGEVFDEIQLQRFYEEYEYYCGHGGNSYIKHKFEKLKSDGKL